MDNIKSNYKKWADFYLPQGWEKENKNNLFIAYTINENNPNLRDAYFSAIIYRYFPVIDKLYFNDKNSASKEDIHEWVVEAALYTLEKRMWENPKSSVYRDPNGPDKIMNRMIKSFRLLHYEKTNSAKRKLMFNNLSIEGLEEASGDYIIQGEYDRNLKEFEDPTRDIVIKAFKKKDYFKSFMIFNIVSQDVFDDKNLLSAKKLNSSIRNMNDNMCKDFSLKYGLNFKEVQEASNICKSLSSNRIYTAIKRNLNLLAKNEYSYIKQEM